MNPVAQFALDLLEGAVYGAAIALLAMPDSAADGRMAALAAFGGAVGGVKAVARRALVSYTQKGRAS